MPQQNASLPAGRTRVAWSRLTPVRDDTRRRVRTRGFPHDSNRKPRTKPKGTSSGFPYPTIHHS